MAFNTDSQMRRGPGGRTTAEKRSCRVDDVDEQWVHVIDQYGQMHAITRFFMTYQGAPPKPGQNWMITNEYGDWQLSGRLQATFEDTDTAQIRGSNVAPEAPASSEILVWDDTDEMYKPGFLPLAALPDHSPLHLPNGGDAIDWAGKINMKGILADRPAAAASNAGCTYFVTNDFGGTLYRSTGSVWEQVSVGLNAPRGRVASTKKTTDGPLLTLGTVESDVSGMSVTFTAVAGRRYKVSAIVTFFNDGGAGDFHFCWISEGSTHISAAASSGYVETGFGETMNMWTEVTPTAASHTYKLRASSAFYFFHQTAVAAEPGIIMVEDIGV
jgi:hypothetical protein